MPPHDAPELVPDPAASTPDAAVPRTILDHLPLMVFWKDTQYRFRGHNRCFRDTLGLADSAAVFGLTDADLLGDTEAVRQYRACDERVMQTGEPQLNIEETLVGRDGAAVTLLTSKVPIRGESGEVTGVLGVACDITGQKKMQHEVEHLRVEAEERARAAQEHERVLRSVLESIPHIVFWKDREGVYRGGNENLARVAGFASAAELVGVTDFDCAWTREEAESYLRCDAEIMDRGLPLLNIEETQLNAEGEETVLLTSKVPLRDEGREVVGVLGLVTDIPERKRAEREREELQRRLVAASRDAGKAEVATGVLHNVGNAFNGISVGVELLHQQVEASPAAVLERLAETLRPHADDFGAYVRENPRAEQVPRLIQTLSDALAEDRRRLRETVARLHEQVAHVKEVVSSQQAFSRSRSAPEPSEAADLAGEAVRIALAGRTPPGLTVEVVPDARPLRLVVDRHLVVQVLVNLINNACQAMPGAPHHGRIRLGASPDPAGDVARFRVDDNGKGIASEVLPRLFEHGFTTRNDGHGFGLHTAALAAQSLGGRLEAQSDGPGRGARFTLTVPLEPVVLGGSAAAA